MSSDQSQTQPSISHTWPYQQPTNPPHSKTQINATQYDPAPHNNNPNIRRIKPNPNSGLLEPAIKGKSTTWTTIATHHQRQPMYPTPNRNFLQPDLKFSMNIRSLTTNLLSSTELTAGEKGCRSSGFLDERRESPVLLCLLFHGQHRQIIAKSGWELCGREMGSGRRGVIS